jgi:predicted O-linked N-acetylglucosamine transferase (SPINDLY family)
MTLYSSGKLIEAIAEIKILNESYPNVPLLFNILGACYQAQGKLKDSVKMFETATKIKPDYAEAHFNLGVVLKTQGQLENAIESYKKAIYLVPNYPAAHNNLGNAYKDLNQLDDAIRSYQAVIKMNPSNAEAHFNLGNVHKRLGNIDDSIINFKRAIKIFPDYYDARNNLAVVLRKQKKLHDSLTEYDYLIKLKPDAELVPGYILQIKKDLCIWDKSEKELNEIIKKINQKQNVCGPFSMLGFTDNPLLHKKVGEIFSDSISKNLGNFNKMTTNPKNKKIRIGYFSADFHNHATMHLMAELFELHNKNLFEIYAFSFGPNKQDDSRRRARLAFNEFFDVELNTDYEIALLAREQKIDIAIDLKGYTQDCRPKIFVIGCAPIQINYLGYPGTMGASFMDYIVADKTLISQKHEQNYTEKIVYMPYSYQVNISNLSFSKSLFSRGDLNLPSEGFVFCCFNSVYKITPEVFAGWMRILKSVSMSVLWIYSKNSFAIENLKQEAVKHGIDENRLIFASFMTTKDHLKRIQSADLFLDTLPYNAHTTASDALRVGLPVLTRIGESFTSRVASSLLNGVNLPELITTSQEEYEALAIELATNPKKYKSLKDKLINNLPEAPLYDTSLFTRHIESAYKTMYERHHEGLEPENIYVEY